eukprot:gene4281-biopygen4889
MTCEQPDVEVNRRVQLQPSRGGCPAAPASTPRVSVRRSWRCEWIGTDRDVEGPFRPRSRPLARPPTGFSAAACRPFFGAGQRARAPAAPPRHRPPRDWGWGSAGDPDAPRSITA